MTTSSVSNSKGEGQLGSHGAPPLWRWIVVGVLSTILMDICAGITAKTGLTAGLPIKLTGTWFSSVLHGTIFVPDIRVAGVAPLPMPLVVLIHYSIGATFSVIFGLIARSRWSRIPPWAPLVFGFSTTLVPAFFMFPAMGLGILGQDAPPEWMLFRTSTINHIYFGLGLALVSRLLVRPAGAAQRSIEVPPRAAA